ncbi:MAG: hypothetical protein HOK30_25540 [Rhodospirillaceae bacterium]|nr:hypothetical protein [Rhodospirillaceae bacterium]
MAKIINAEDINIPVGQSFRANDGMLWEFAGLAPTQDRVPHAKLVKPADKLTTKIISASALFDKRLFNPID